MSKKMITVSFGEYDDEIYNFIKSKKNSSAFIRYIIGNYMRGQKCEMSNITPEENVFNNQEKIVQTNISDKDDENSDEKKQNLNKASNVNL